MATLQITKKSLFEDKELIESLLKNKFKLIRHSNSYVLRLDAIHKKHDNAIQIHDDCSIKYYKIVELYGSTPNEDWIKTDTYFLKNAEEVATKVSFLINQFNETDRI